MKYQNLFSGKNKKNISNCRLLKILPGVLSVKFNQQHYDKESACKYCPFYTPANDSGGVVWFYVGHLCVCLAVHIFKPFPDDNLGGKYQSIFT